MRIRTLALVATLVAAACGGASDLEHPVDMPHQSNVGLDWRDQVIYQIMVDRFADGDQNNNMNVQPSVPGKFHGGDWQGIIDHLDYLKDLGVTALWISPWAVKRACSFTKTSRKAFAAMRSS